MDPSSLLEAPSLPDSSVKRQRKAAKLDAFDGMFSAFYVRCGVIPIVTMCARQRLSTRRPRYGP